MRGQSVPASMSSLPARAVLSDQSRSVVRRRVLGVERGGDGYYAAFARIAGQADALPTCRSESAGVVEQDDAMTGIHEYVLDLRWTGNLGTGTSGYRDYSRAHEVRAEGKPVIAGTSEPSFRGDHDRWTPEELLIAALAQCHLLWYLHLAAVAGIVVTDYTDAPVGTMRVDRDGGGQFTGVTLHPVVTVAEQAMLAGADEVHAAANDKCFIARSVNFPVRHEPMARLA
jgi:organic hydroperoxide reductase OsmC/OhrA